ncbi:MAG: amino acid adenylation domain-containing protein [Candidatus Velthaea sp.]
MQRALHAPIAATQAPLAERLWGPEAPRPPELAPVPRTAATRLPLTAAQKRFWLFDRLEPGSHVYSVGEAFRVRGPLDAGHLQAALDVVLRRHEILRTAFGDVDGEPRQRVVDSARVVLETADVSATPGGERLDRATALCAASQRRAFDLAEAPLVRALLVRVAADDHVLSVTLHHIIADDTGRGNFLHDLSVAYAAVAAGKTPELDSLPVQYADFALWQDNLFDATALNKQQRYWRRTLAGPLPTLELPADRPRPPTQRFAGARVRVTLEPACVAALRALAHGEGATLFMALMAAYQTLLHRYTAQTDLLVGFPVAGRAMPATHALVGCFINTVVLRANITRDVPFRTFLRRVRDRALEAYDNQDLPFQAVVETAAPERRLNTGTLVQTMMQLRNTRRPSLRVPNACVEPIAVETGASKTDLLLDALESPDGIVCTFEYDTDLFDESSISRLAHNFKTLVHGIVSNPDLPVGRLALLSAAERASVEREWNATEVPLPAQCAVHRLFETQVRRAPDAAAIVSGTESLSYGELNARANRLARRLRAAGALRRDSYVGVCLERSAEAVIAFVAVLKAGAAYMPLDPSYPANRLAFMLQDANPVAVIATTATVAVMEAGAIPCILLDRDAAAIDAESGADLGGVAADGSALAALLYTSGSTGRPKGVMLEHRSIVRLVMKSDVCPITPSDVLSHAASISFDAATFEVWGALLNGARLAIVPKDVVLAPAALFDALAQYGVTVAFFTTALFNILAEADAAGFRRLRSVIIGGEALDPRWIRAVQHNGPRALVNAYGPTEAATFATSHRIVERCDGATPISIGTPIANTTAYVLDAEGELVPIGVAGELYIGGPGVARGYHDRPDLTREKFVRDPFSADPRDRLYRTGDRVRREANGRLTFLGRIDRQVKIRGFRIEPGEIEAALAQHPAVRDAVVTVETDSSGDKRLVAHVARAGDACDGAALRGWLRGRLPEFMVPGRFVLLEALPLNANGKIDRAALATAPRTRAGATTAVTPQRTSTEERLARIWSDILGVEHVKSDDDFFSLGGHSLSAARLAARVHDELGKTIPLRTLFEYPTVAGLAAALAEQPAAVASGDTVPRLAQQTAYPLSFAQQRLWFVQQFEPLACHYHLVRVFRLTGRLDRDALVKALDALVARHEALRTRFPLAGDAPVQCVDAPGPMHLETLDLRAHEPSERARFTEARVAQEHQRPFDLVRGPLVRAALIALDAHDHRLLLAFHHIITDGWSESIFGREFGALYTGFAGGANIAAALADVPARYVDVAAWQRASLSGATLEGHQRYWRARLAKPLPPPALPPDHARPARQSFHGEHVRGVIPADVATALHDVSRRGGATLFMTALAAFTLLLHRRTGRSDIVVGTAVSGRRRLEMEAVIGFFVNSLPVRMDVSGSRSFAELLAHVRSRVLEALDHQDLPFEQIVGAADAERRQNRHPLFDIMFVVQNAPRSVLHVPELEVTPETVNGHTSKFDLTVELTESDRGLEYHLEYATDLFEHATIERLADDYATLLREVSGGDVVSIGAALPQLPADEEPCVVPKRECSASGPLNTREARLAEIWMELLHVDRPAADDDFFELGGHSLLAARLIARIEERFGTRLSFATLFEHPTIRHLARALGSDAPPEAATPLIVAKRGTGLPLVLFSGDVGAGNAYFRRLVKYVGDRTVYVLPPHGLDGGPIPPTIEAMAADALATLDAHGVSGPYAVAGYCNGALVAFELARRLAERGAAAPCVILVAAHACSPQLVRIRKLLHTFARPLRLSAQSETRWSLRMCDRIERLRKAGGARGVVRVLGSEMRRALARVRRPAASAAHARPAGTPDMLFEYYQRVAGYVAQPYEGRVCVFKPAGETQPRGLDASLGWAGVAREAVVEEIPGDHFSILTTHAVALGERLRARLDALSGV